MAYLVYYIDEGLCLFLKETTDCVAHVVTREDGLDQEGEFMRSERTSDQTPTGWQLKCREKKSQRAISIPHKTAKVELKTYRLRMQRLRRCQRGPNFHSNRLDVLSACPFHLHLHSSPDDEL